jgi:hypothetical protein
MAVILAVESTVKLVAGELPNLTALTFSKSLPTIATAVPPVMEPAAGAMAPSVGVACTSALKAAISSVSLTGAGDVAPSVSAGSQ